MRRDEKQLPMLPWCDVSVTWWPSTYDKRTENIGHSRDGEKKRCSTSGKPLRRETTFSWLACAL